jgi:ribosomal protein S6--L-glutamate ligase
MRCLQILAEAGLRVPITVLCRSPKSLKKALEAVHGVPVILKLLQGTQGVGVMLVHSPASLQSVLDTLNTLEQDVIIQEFLRESAGRDYRAVVVGGVVVASMMRQAPQGEFRSNIHRGGAGVAIKLPPAYERAAIRAASVVGLRIAGVDLMETPSGPAVIEVNSSPGFEGIERSTGKNVAIHLMKQVIREARLHARSQRIKRQKKLQRKRK